jgi:hypothetical protein
LFFFIRKNALDHPVRDPAAALVGHPEVEAHVAVDAEGLGVVGEDVGDLGVADERLGRDAAHVEAHPTPVLLLDDRGGEPELRGADGGHVAAGSGADDDDVKMFGHGFTL